MVLFLILSGCSSQKTAKIKTVKDDIYSCHLIKKKINYCYIFQMAFLMRGQQLNQSEANICFQTATQIGFKGYFGELNFFFLFKLFLVY